MSTYQQQTIITLDSVSWEDVSMLQDSNYGGESQEAQQRNFLYPHPGFEALKDFSSVVLRQDTKSTQNLA